MPFYQKVNNEIIWIQNIGRIKSLLFY